jgi:hypothetical protein
MVCLKYKILIPVLLLSLLAAVSATEVSAQDAFLGGPVDKRILPRHARKQAEHDLPSYMPRPHPSWDGKKIRGRFVRQNSNPIGNVGYAIGRPPPKSSSKQFHPRRRNTTAGFGSVGMF